MTRESVRERGLVPQLTDEFAGFTYENGMLTRADIPVARESAQTYSSQV